MKKLLLVSLIAFAFIGIACNQAPDYATVELSNPDGLPVAFTGYYSSDQVDSTGVDGTTPATYRVDVNPDGDHVTAGFIKTTITDAENELKVELYYNGELKEAQTVKIPIVGLALVNADIP